jgi:hypothetical protein
VPRRLFLDGFEHPMMGKSKILINMQSILNNPYRICGLLVGATTREQSRQVRRLKKYLGASMLKQSINQFKKKKFYCLFIFDKKRLCDEK